MDLQSIAAYQITWEFSGLNDNIYYLTVYVGQDSGSSLAARFWLRVSLAVTLLAGAALSEALTRAGRSASKKLTHMVGSWCVTPLHGFSPSKVPPAG